MTSQAGWRGGAHISPYLIRTSVPLASSDVDYQLFLQLAACDAHNVWYTEPKSRPLRLRMPSPPYHCNKREKSSLGANVVSIT